MTDAERVFLRSRLINNGSRRFRRCILNLLILVALLLPALIWPNSPVAAILGTADILLWLPIWILLSRDGRREVKLTRKELQMGVVECYEMPDEFLTGMSEKDSGEGGPTKPNPGTDDLDTRDALKNFGQPSFARLASGRIMIPESDTFKLIEGVAEPVRVARVDPDFSPVRSLTKEEQAEIEDALTRKPKLVLPIALTIWWTMGLVSAIGGALEGLNVVSWPVLGIVVLLHWGLVIRKALFLRRLRQVSVTGTVTRIEDIELLGDPSEGRLLWSIGNAPAPWRRVA